MEIDGGAEGGEGGEGREGGGRKEVKTQVLSTQSAWSV